MFRRRCRVDPPTKKKKRERRLHVYEQIIYYTGMKAVVPRAHPRAHAFTHSWKEQQRGIESDWASLGQLVLICLPSVAEPVALNQRVNARPLESSLVEQFFVLRFGFWFF
jgi:hypothetical protein